MSECEESDTEPEETESEENIPPAQLTKSTVTRSEITSPSDNVLCNRSNTITKRIRKAGEPEFEESENKKDVESAKNIPSTRCITIGRKQRVINISRAISRFQNEKKCTENGSVAHIAETPKVAQTMPEEIVSVKRRNYTVPRPETTEPSKNHPYNINSNTSSKECKKAVTKRRRQKFFNGKECQHNENYMIAIEEPAEEEKSGVTRLLDSIPPTEQLIEAQPNGLVTIIFPAQDSRPEIRCKDIDMEKYEWVKLLPGKTPVNPPQNIDEYINNYRPPQIGVMMRNRRTSERRTPHE